MSANSFFRLSIVRDARSRSKQFTIIVKLTSPDTKLYAQKNENLGDTNESSPKYQAFHFSINKLHT